MTHKGCEAELIPGIFTADFTCGSMQVKSATDYNIIFFFTMSTYFRHKNKRKTSSFIVKCSFLA